MKMIPQRLQPRSRRSPANEPGPTDRRRAGIDNNGRLGAVILTLIVAASVAACGNVVITPVDHTCPTNPSKHTDSGCSYRG